VQDDLVNDIPYGLPSIAALIEAATRTVNAAEPVDESAAQMASAASLVETASGSEASAAAVGVEATVDPQTAAVSTPDPISIPNNAFDGLNDLWIEAGGDGGIRHGQTPEPQAAAADDGVSADQILRDRPDVLKAFYTEFWGPNNDRHSHAWVDRVGGDTPQDYARYWYDKMGGKDVYQPSAHAAAAPAEGVPDDGVAVGRTTIDGIPLSQILHDRPDVFQAFFTEYYGPNNDRHSSAWDDRVGGHTPEDYANFWYNTGGKLEGYVPSTAQVATPDLPADGAPSDPAVDDGQVVVAGQSLMVADPITGI
jgi:hypothetical protein